MSALRRWLRWKVGSHACPPIHWSHCFSPLLWLQLACACVRDRPWCEVGRGKIELRYTEGTLVVGALALLCLSCIPSGWRWPFVVVPLYFVVDLVAFILRWLFVDRGRLLSARRALRGFLVNGIGVTVFFAAAFTGSGCIEEREAPIIATALYASFRTFTTMGPPDTLREAFWPCQGLIVAEGVMAYLLTVAIIGAVAGLVVAERK